MSPSDIKEILQKYPEPDEFANHISNLLNNIPYEQRVDKAYEVGEYLYNNYYFEHAKKIFELCLSFVISNNRQMIADCLISLGNAFLSLSNPQ